MVVKQKPSSLFFTWRRKKPIIRFISTDSITSFKMRHMLSCLSKNSDTIGCFPHAWRTFDAVCCFACLRCCMHTVSLFCCIWLVQHFCGPADVVVAKSTHVLGLQAQGIGLKSGLCVLFNSAGPEQIWFNNFSEFDESMVTWRLFASEALIILMAVLVDFDQSLENPLQKQMILCLLVMFFESTVLLVCMMLLLHCVAVLMCNQSFPYAQNTQRNVEANAGQWTKAWATDCMCLVSSIFFCSCAKRSSEVPSLQKMCCLLLLDQNWQINIYVSVFLCGLSSDQFEKKEWNVVTTNTTFVDIVPLCSIESAFGVPKSCH